MNEQPEQTQEQQSEPVPIVTQPLPPQTEVPVQPTEPAKPKSKKKLLIITLVTLLILGVGAGAWFYFNKDSDSNPQTNNVETTESTEVVSATPQVFVQNGNKVQYIDENSELQEFATLEDKSLVTEVLTQNGQPRVMYMIYEETENGAREATSYNEITAEGKKKLFDFPDMADASWSMPILSPDGKTLVVEVSNVEGFMNNLTKIDVATGKAEIVFEPEEEYGTGVVIGWFDNSTILMQKQSCRQCDGPREAELSKISLETKSKTPFFDLNQDDVSFAEFIWSADGKRLFMMGGDHAMMFETTPDTKTISYLHEINLTSGTSVEVAQYNQTYVDFNGVSGNGDEAYLSTRIWEKTDEANADYQSAEGNYNLSVRDILTQKTTGGTPGSFTFSEDEDVSIESITEFNGSLIVQTSMPKDTSYSETVYQVSAVSKNDNNSTKSLLEATYSNNTQIVATFSIKR